MGSAKTTKRSNPKQVVDTITDKKDVKPVKSLFIMKGFFALAVRCNYDNLHDT